jgi:hypothetical protein
MGCSSVLQSNDGIYMYHQKSFYSKFVWIIEDRENYVIIVSLGFLFLSFGVKNDILN